MNERLLIDKEFQGLLRPLSEDEYDQLERNIVDAGKASDPIVTWDNKIVDGHHRYKICCQHNLSYETRVLAAQTREEVRAWIIQHQYGRRNLTPQELSYMRAKRASSGAWGERGNAEQVVADAAGVSTRTIRNDKAFAENVDMLPNDLKDAVLSGAVKVSRIEIAELAHAEPGDQAKIISEGIAVLGTNIDQIAVPYRRAILDIQRILRDTKIICDNPDVGHYLATKQTRITTLLKEVEDAFKQCEPVSECEKCEGDKCKECYSTGFLSRAALESKGL
jgi:hypothetical protein